ncbi:RMD1 family protein [Alkalithermobacter paradoxus]|uniref:DUF155 domain-containing protein n=1 Tax=Alkalithermobacter paradoxus TaxID=29349 RepID=A0A1V4I8N7_9FIRM|nr:hypothetical protein CLOTH_07720 [[Clostridium] thermoalcaliphilum]
MEQIVFKSIVVAKEININNVAKKFNIYKKYKWEEPLILRNKDLQRILGANIENKSIYIFSFGSIIFINMEESEIPVFIDYIRDSEIKINSSYLKHFSDEFYLRLLPDSELAILDDGIIVPEIKDYYLTIISTVLGKSVALERVEEDIYKIFDNFEPTLEILERGKLNIRDKVLAKHAADILRFKYQTISYIMIDEIPDIAWQNSEIEKFYIELSSFFDLNDRYESTNHKIEILLTVLNSYSNLVEARRSANLEWMIILLFVFDIILSFFH